MDIRIEMIGIIARNKKNVMQELYFFNHWIQFKYTIKCVMIFKIKNTLYV